MLTEALQSYRYVWPPSDLAISPHWRLDDDGLGYVREMPESREELARDSRWPAFFPSPICLVTTSDGTTVALEKVVGASIVNRFPYVVALSFCIEALSPRHYVRRCFTDLLERGGGVAIQFLPPGPALDRAMGAILTVPEDETGSRIARSGLPTRRALTNAAPVFTDAYLVYEARLVRPSKDFQGEPIYTSPWLDVGSHRVYFLEITAIQLRQDIADGRAQIRWRSLPCFAPQQVRANGHGRNGQHEPTVVGVRYQKPYTPHYVFPSAGTVAFEADAVAAGMAIKHLPPLPEDQVEVDNDRARWPCFFPSSLGMITSWTADGKPNLMPCGSTTIVSRHPLIITPCVSYTTINERYARRATLDIIRQSGRFGCGVPYIDSEVLGAIRYAGNISMSRDPDKLSRTGLVVDAAPWAPVLPHLPVHFDCDVVGEVRLGTHIMFLGEVRRIRVRADVTADNPIEWCPWPDVTVAEPRTASVGQGD